MAETLGSLCDKLTIIKLKQWHSDDESRQISLANQQQSIQEEIDQFLIDAISGLIPEKKITFNANKVFKKEGNDVKEVLGSIGDIFSELAKINCELWHEQEKVYEFEKVPNEEKNNVVKQLAILNLQRNKCIDAIDNNLLKIITKK
ncbi:MAG: hypothetical protein EAZ53_07510 [Bacteroidetes bacterium]|nr:MAG: hypothetical protein EAZ53_07510 [Bacteroidota bacterium]